MYTLINNEFTVKMQYSGWKLIYKGEAQPGTATSASHWRISKMFYSGENQTDVKWAEGTNEFNKIWDNRTTYSYS